MYRKWMSVCISALSALAMHFTFAIIVQLCFSASVFPIIIMIVGTLFLWMICGGWCRRWLGLSPSAPTFVFFNVFFLWGVYIFLIRKDVGPAMDAAFNAQCLVLAVGLWRMLLSDPGYVRYENTFAESIDQTIFSETKTDQLGIVDHFSGTIGNDETASDNRLFVRARYCRKCKAYVDRFDHHCPAIGNCVGQRNHRLFILLLVTFVSAEMCYFLCSISCIFVMAPLKSTAEGWKYVEKLDRPHGRHLKCNLCNNEFFGSLTRVMDHLLSVTNGKGGGVEGCKNVSAELKETLQKDYDNIQKAKKVNENKRQRVQTEIAMNYNSLSALSSSTVGVGSSSQSKISKSSGTATLNTLWKPMQKQEVDDAVGDMFFECAIPFNVARSPYFINACKMMAGFGKGYLPPSSETIRTTILKRSKERVTNNLQKIKDSWKETGCTILSDGWSDMNHRPLINVLVSCPKGVLFLKVVDASGNKKTSEFIFKILEEAILEVGEENVVQVITDSASNCVGAGKMVMDKYRKIYWTPCAAHCLDLLLHDLAKFPWINETVRRGKQISHFIFNHQLTLSLYRNNASRELLRPCDTRFATYYITIKRLVEEKGSIRGVFCNNEWEKSHLSKEAKGKELEQVILGTAFWDNAEKVLKVCEPIVDMLRMVDSDTPSMGFVYEGMDRAKEAIAKSFNNEENEYIAIWEMIDERWKMLHSPLHAAACYLDPRLFGIERTNDAEVMNGLYDAVERLVPDQEECRRIREQLRAYRLEEGIFARSSAVQDRPNIPPGRWWQFYGSETPELQRFAVRILSQGSSASACERNWSSFNHIQSKKRNKLLSTRLEDLVYVRSNLKLALSSVAKDASSSYEPWFDADLEPEEDDISTDGDSLDDPNVGIPSIDDFDDHHSSAFTMPYAHDD